MIERIRTLASTLEPELIAARRDFHRHAESAWTEFHTASLVARRLADLNYQVLAGRQVHQDEDRMGLPPAATLDACWQRAVDEGGDPDYLQQMRGGFTGVVGILAGGPGPTVALRFDMDALDIQESSDPQHRPAREGFASIHPGVAHACGHDAHTAIGLAVARVLMELKDQVPGTVKLIFQPAEEGVRGARSMVTAGLLDDVDLVFAHHIYSGWALGELAPAMGGYMATHKFDASFHGRPAHAGGAPHAGRNALLAAATAVLNLYAIPRHADGRTRVNVGRMEAGTGRNVIPESARLLIETRGATTDLDSYMQEKAERILRAAADMYECRLEIVPTGAADSAESDPVLAQRVSAVAQQIGGFEVLQPTTGGGSEDFCYMMARVQQNGGLAAYVGTGADLNGISRSNKADRGRVLAAHTAVFDIDERALARAVVLLSALALDCQHRPVERD